MMRGEVSKLKNEFAQFSETSRLWIYGFQNPLGAPHRQQIAETLQAFLPSWASHGAPVEGAFAIAEDRFVLLAGQLGDGISGCAIDSSVRCFTQLRDHYGLDGLDRSLVFYRDTASAIQAVSFFDFQHLVDDGTITSGTRVFDNTIDTVGQLRQGAFEMDFDASWHARRFGPVNSVEPLTV